MVRFPRKEYANRSILVTETFSLLIFKLMMILEMFLITLYCGQLNFD